MKTSILFLFATLFFANDILSQPANDNCNGAVTLTSGLSCSNTAGTTDAATADNFPTDPPACDNAATSLGAGVFYKFVAQSNSQTITIDPTGASTLDAVVVVYDGTNCFNLDEFDCEDTPGGNGATTTLTNSNFINGTTYYIRVYDYGSANATNGNFNICVTHIDVTCSNIDLTPDNETHGAGSFSTTFQADDIILDAQPFCDYTISESCNWLTITNGTSGTTNSNGQAFINYSITTNTSSSPRTCNITVNGTPLTITQNGCVPDFNRATSSNVSASGANITNVSVDAVSGCPWTIQNSCNWVSVDQTSGTGDYDLTITVDANTTTVARTCTLSIGNETHIISQVAQQCDNSTATLSAVSQNFSDTGGSGNFNVTFNPAATGCEWIVNQNDCSWITGLTPSSPQTASGSVSFTVPANTGAARSCTLKVSAGNNTYDYIITQDQLNVGVNNLSSENDLKIFPNPATRTLHITATINSNNKIHYQIFNLLGEVVIENKTTKKEFTVDVSKLINGIYIIQLQSGNEKISKRFIKQ